MWAKVTLATLSSSFLLIYFLKKYFRGVNCKCKNRLDDKVIIITGASSGIGKEAATILAKQGAKVVLACRSSENGQKTASFVSEVTGNACVKYESLDLSSFQSIIDFVNRFKNSGCALFGLVNNAGIFYVPLQLTKDGFDLTLQINFLGPFLLTYLLMNTLKDSAPSRIVNLGSESHRYPKELDISLLQHNFYGNKDFDKFMIYGISKLCLMLISSKLATRLSASTTSSTKSTATPVTKEFLIKTLEAFKQEMFEELKKYSAEFIEFRATLDFVSDGMDKSTKAMESSTYNVSVNSVDPGNVRSNIHRYFPIIKDIPLISISRFLLWLTFKTPYQGAQTVVHLLLDEKLQNITGKYFSECSEKTYSSLIASPALQDKLWEFTVTLFHQLIHNND